MHVYACNKINAGLHEFMLQQPNYQYQLPPAPKVVVPQLENASPPHDFLVLAVVVTTICALLNLLSLSFGIPAVILSVLVSPLKFNFNI